MTNNDRKPLIKDFSNAEQRSLYLQWDRLKLIKNKLYREYIDKRDVIIYQYIVPSSKRDYVLANMHDTAVCGHLGYEKTRDRIKHKLLVLNGQADTLLRSKLCKLPNEQSY